MRTSIWNRIEVGLVLQGGGALGAYEWGAIEALFALMDQLEQQGTAISLKAVTGVSIGAINGACIVGAKDRADGLCRLAALWGDLKLETPFDVFPFPPGISPSRDLSLFGLPGFYAPRIDVWNVANWTSVYHTRPLETTLKKHVCFEEIDRSQTTFVVTAVDIERGTLKRFRNTAANKKRQLAEPTDPKSEENKYVAAFEPHHIIASGSLAPQFPWTTIDDKHYWDGGIVDHTPLGDAMDAFSKDDNVYRLLVVMNLYPLQADVPRNLLDVADRVHELSYGNRLRQDRASARRINDLVRTIDGLRRAAGDAKVTLSRDLRDLVDKTRRYKIAKTVQIDLQKPSGLQDPTDGEAGLRDFSPRTVEKRRVDGRKRATAALIEALQKDGFSLSHSSQAAAAPVGN